MAISFFFLENVENSRQQLLEFNFEKTMETDRN